MRKLDLPRLGVMSGGNRKKKGGNSNKSGGANPKHDKSYEAFKASQSKKEKRKDRKDTAKTVVKMLKKEDSKSDQSTKWLSSTESSDSDTSDDADGVSRRRYRRCKKAAEAKAAKAAELEKEVTTLRDQVSSHTKLVTAVTTTLSPAKGSSRSVTIDKAAWEELQERMAPKPPKATGLFDAHFGVEQKTVTAKDVLVVLEGKMKTEEESVSFEGQAGRVNDSADKQIRLVSGQVVDAYPVLKDKESAEFLMLMAIKSTYIGSNGSKNPDTILAALLRSLTSRKVPVSPDDLGISA